MLPGNRELVASGVNELRAPPEQRGTAAEPSKKKNVSKIWPGKWGRRAEVIATTEVNLVSRDRGVDMDPALWGELQYYIDLEKVAAGLPLDAFFRARSVCKKWNALPWNRPYLEQHSTTSLPDLPYFILHGKRGCHQAMLVKDVMQQKWILKPLPTFAFHHHHTSVAHGVVYTCTNEAVVQGTVFNTHTKVFRRLPPLTLGSGRFDSGAHLDCSKIAVDKHSGSYKVLAASNKGRNVWVYESVTGEWTQKAASPADFCLVEDATHCDGVMYIKWRGQVKDVMPPGQMVGPPPPHVLRSQRPKVFAYNFREDLWTVLPMATPPLRMFDEQGWQDMFVRGLGEWRGALRDVTFDIANRVLHVWEFERTIQDWREVDRMPANILNWFLDPQASSFQRCECRKIIKTSYCEHYMLVWNHGFPRTSGIVRFVLYDMALKLWETLNVGKDWSCSQCPFDC